MAMAISARGPRRHDGCREGGGRPQLAHGADTAGDELSPRHDQQRGHQHEERDLGVEPGQDEIGLPGHFVAQHVHGDADADGAGERQGEAAEGAHGGGAEGGNEDEQEDVEVDPQRRRQHYARDRNETGPDRPGVAPDHDRVGGFQRQEGGRVDHGLHGDAEPGAAEEQVEPDRGEHGDGHRDELAPQDVHAQEVDPLGRQEGVELNGRLPVGPGQHGLEEHDQTDGGHDLHGRRGAGEPEGDPLEQERAAEPDEEHGSRGRPPARGGPW